MDVSENGGFPQKPWVFPTKMIILGCEMGVPPFEETNLWMFPKIVVFPLKSSIEK